MHVIVNERKTWRVEWVDWNSKSSSLLLCGTCRNTTPPSCTALLHPLTLPPSLTRPQLPHPPPGPHTTAFSPLNPPTQLPEHLHIPPWSEINEICVCVCMCMKKDHVREQRLKKVKVHMQVCVCVKTESECLCLHLGWSECLWWSQLEFVCVFVSLCV